MSLPRAEKPKPPGLAVSASRTWRCSPLNLRMSWHHGQEPLGPAGLAGILTRPGRPCEAGSVCRQGPALRRAVLPGPSLLTPCLLSAQHISGHFFFFLEHEELLDSNPELFPATADFLAGTEASNGNRNTCRWPPSPPEPRAPAAGASRGWKAGLVSPPENTCVCPRRTKGDLF